MSPVVLTFAPAAEHVRTARLVVVAVARRAGLHESRLDDVRLAVGEMCARAVSRCGMSRWPADEHWVIRVEVDDSGPVLDVSVADPAGVVELPEESITLAMAAALSDAIEVVTDHRGAPAVVHLRWNRFQPGPGDEPR
ncbi:MAG: ATP-binding protein [Kineosporiaceae bacterium]|jgi:hypothetical protein